MLILLGNNSFKPSFLSRLHTHLTGIHSDDILVVTLVVLFSQLHVLHFNFLPLQTDNSHSFGVDLVESFHKFVGIPSSKA